MPPKLIDRLMFAGVDVDGANLFGQSACFLAEWYGHSPAVDLLKSYGALSVTRPERPELPRWQPSLSDRQVEELPGNSWLLERSFEEAFLREFDSLAARLPVPDMEVDRRTAQRLFVCSEEISEALGALLRPSFQEVWVSPWLRFLRYRSAGVPLAPHVDYQWLPGYVSAKIPGYSPARRTTHSLLLYLTDCYEGGETRLLHQGPKGGFGAATSTDAACGFPR
ncbi:Hypothetical protein (Fragment), partial [Durusdinium trenchii]